MLLALWIMAGCLTCFAGAYLMALATSRAMTATYGDRDCTTIVRALFAATGMAVAIHGVFSLAFAVIRLKGL